MHSRSTGCLTRTSLRTAVTHTTCCHIRGRVRPVRHNVHSQIVSSASPSVEITKPVSHTVKVPEVQLPAESARNFKQKFESQQADLNWMIDSIGFEQKASKVLSAACDADMLQQLAGFTTDPSAPSALLLTGLPVEDDLPATRGAPPIAKASQLTEALLFGFGSLWGHAFGYEGMQKRGCIRDLIASNSSAFSSTTELDMHRDFGFAAEQFVPHLRLILCMRPDKAREVETLICDNRELLKHLSDEEISLLRTIPITFYGPNSVEVGGAKPTITGSADDPCVNLFDVGVFGAESGYRADNPAAVEAYGKASRIAKEIALRVKLSEGQMLIINNNRATHARTESLLETDGYGRWLKVTHVRSDVDPGNRYLAVA